MKFKFFYLLTTLCWCAFGQLPEGFVYVNKLIPDIKVELRYCQGNNFVGERIDGYNDEVVILTKEAAVALKNVQEALKPKGLGLMVYDAYRPQRAVNHFVRWAKQVNDTVMKQQFYPAVNKRNLFKQGYIASKSRHSSGSTIDLTIVDLKTGTPLDMGTPYDFFGQQSWVAYSEINKEQQANRQLLQDVMLSNGFRNYPKEWWHFTLRGEPYRNKYFDFLVE
ncbi:M15 family metallopeptidase [Lacinutrix salivirga]